MLAQANTRFSRLENWPRKPVRAQLGASHREMSCCLLPAAHGTVNNYRCQSQAIFLYFCK